MTGLQQLARNKDLRAIAILILLWLLFFWRLFTPVAADQASLTQGDFSGQFVAFGGYQYERLSRGEIPLWNPYNNGGLPFIADSQAAVFYPPRWITIGLSALAGGWSYNALQLEMTAHVLLYTLLMYAFLRRLTLHQELSHLAALAASLIVGYGGFTAGYPPLQLALLEAAVWLPLTLLGIGEAARNRRLAPRFLALAGFALGLSWLAGHPQTSWFASCLAAAYLAYRCFSRRMGWRAFTGALVMLALVAIGTTSVTLLPGIEYLLHTTREGLGFAAKGNGFPFRDIAQFLFPGSVSQWSPLYLGLPALFLVAVALFRRARESRFWLAVAIVALLHSLGENSAFYYASYNLMPGLRFFRGQERAAFLAANSLAILAGLGIIACANWANQTQRDRVLRYWLGFAALLVIFAVGLFLAWNVDAARWGDLFEISARSAVIAAAAYGIMRLFLRQPQRFTPQLALIALIAFELFSVNIDHPANYDPVPAAEQLSMTPPPLVQAVLDDQDGRPFRVDGFRGLRDNFGSLYAVMDMRGISPLFLKGPAAIIYRDYVNNPLAWELFAVKYVFSGSQSLSLPSEVIARGRDQDGEVYLHRLADPRPFARLFYEADRVNSDAWAMALMDDPRYHEREKIVLQGALGHTPPETAAEGTVDVNSFEPEAIALRIDTPENAVLSLALPHYPGWEARLNGQPVEIIRAYAGLIALEIPAGQHSLSLTYTPASYTIGLLISLVTWLGLALFTLLTLLRR
ncbi:MAG: YfhO family protein [Chloroflexota bacterium]|nr:YfhO family protein [Chloroflexota bacterium]